MLSYMMTVTWFIIYESISAKQQLVRKHVMVIITGYAILHLLLLLLLFMQVNYTGIGFCMLDCICLYSCCAHTP